MSVYDQNQGKCFTYDVLEGICITIKPNIDPVTLNEIWEYTGGCFKDDSPTLYQRGVPGTTYDLDSTPIEVRFDNDPFVAASKGTPSPPEAATDLTFFSWLSDTAFSLAIIGGSILAISLLINRRST